MDVRIETLDYPTIRDTFCDELKKSANSETTSLPFIHNTLPLTSLVQCGEAFQVFVIGGTNGETATVQYEPGGNISILRHVVHPEFAKFTTAERLLKFIDEQVEDSTKALGLNFAFTLIPAVGDLGQLDGVMVSGDTKGHAFGGMQRERVGAIIEKYFRATHRRDLIVSVGNDTVCLIASKAAQGVNRATLAAGIVGTGYNMAFFLGEHTIINVQASDFTGFTATTTGRIVDRESTNVGEQLYNKEVAAGELFKHFNALELPGANLQSTKELAALAISHMGIEGNAARALFKRSASLVAAQFAGLYNFKGRPSTLTVVMQGGLFWNGPNYKEMVQGELERLGIPAGAIIFEKVEHADILGAAKLITGGL